MTMKIVFKNVLNEKGIPKCQIMSIDGVMREDKLPEEYIDGKPSVIGIDNGIKISNMWSLGDGYSCYKVGDLLKPENKEDLICYMKGAGEYLSQINEKNRSRKVRWEGIEEVIEI
jgi:hypothetical protein